MNLPNQLTVSRFGLTVVFLVVFFSRFRYADTVALFVFALASLTDYWDGKIARRDKLITNFGILMDPLADKMLVCSAFIAFVDRDFMSAWMVVIVVARELAITGLRMLAASQQRVLAAERYGKHKTISQIVAVIAILVMASYPEWGWFGRDWLHWWVPGFAAVAMWISVLLTASSGLLYLWKNREIFLRDA